MTEEGAPDGLQKRRVKELEDFESARRNEDASGDSQGREARPDEEYHENPEDFVQNAAAVSPDPTGAGTRIELGCEAERHYRDEEGGEDPALRDH
jgi:hypothetical protein